MTGAVLGLACFIWSGWAQERPPRGWPVILGVMSAFGLLAALAFGIVAGRNWSAPSALDADAAAMQSYLLVVAVELGACAMGAVALSFFSVTRSYVAVLVLFIVGVHFFSLAALFEMPAMRVVAALVTLASVAALLLSLRSPSQVDPPAPSFWCGVLAAPILLTSSVIIGLRGLLQLV